VSVGTEDLVVERGALDLVDLDDEVHRLLGVR
jgi:hypothetical protein